jgi:hypothetical protein
MITGTGEAPSPLTSTVSGSSSAGNALPGSRTLMASCSVISLWSSAIRASAAEENRGTSSSFSGGIGSSVR